MVYQLIIYQRIYKNIKVCVNSTPVSLQKNSTLGNVPVLNQPKHHGLLLRLSPHDLQTVIILLILALNLERIPTGTCAWMKMGKNKHLTLIARRQQWRSRSRTYQIDESLGKIWANSFDKVAYFRNINRIRQDFAKSLVSVWWLLQK